jgi:hypothetical protein
MRRAMGLVSNSGFCIKDRRIRLALATVFTAEVSIQGLVSKLTLFEALKRRNEFKVGIAEVVVT